MELGAVAAVVTVAAQIHFALDPDTVLASVMADLFLAIVH